MFTLRRLETIEQDIKKSRFLALCAPVASEAAARDFIALNSDPSATHNCWAFRIDQTYRFNDDGEPGGTAGKPILQAIDGQSLDRVAVLVIRWFGGILLGSGGLMRAYGGTAAMCLRAAEKTEIIAVDRATVRCDFSDLALIKARLAGHGAVIVEEAFNATGATLFADVPAIERDSITALVLDISRGRATISFATSADRDCG